VQRLRLESAGPEAAVRAAIGEVPGVRSIASDGRSDTGAARYVVEADRQLDVPAHIAAALAGRGLPLSALAAVPPDLERIFLELTRRRSEAAA
jgi:ABC-2 type transport system ATP-binding protein